MWIIINGDGDMDYTRAYGPFTTESEANERAALLPEDDDDTAWRVTMLYPVAELNHF